MRRRRFLFAVQHISGFSAVIVVLCWGASYACMVHLVWTKNDEHNELISTSGSIYFVQNHKWWRKEKFRIAIDSQPCNSPIVTWPGMFIDSHSNVLGFERVRGQWISPFIEVTDQTEFTSPDRVIAPRTMYSSRTEMDIYGAPFWALALLPIVVNVSCVVLRRKQ